MMPMRPRFAFPLPPPTYPPYCTARNGGQGRAAPDPRRGLTAASAVPQSRGVGASAPNAEPPLDALANPLRLRELALPA
jgi:hypothetical protein